jgi:hypothetical protein
MSVRMLQVVPWTLTLAAAAALAWALDTSRPDPDLFARTPLPGAPIDAAPRDEPEEVDVALTTPDPGGEVDFERFAFDDYDPPELRTAKEALSAEVFPESVRVLDGLELAVGGYTQVLEVEDGAVPELLLTRFPPGCCFGAIPVYDEWIRLELAEPLPAEDVPPVALARGRLSVGEELGEDGTAQSLYRMTAAEIEEP